MKELFNRDKGAEWFSIFDCTRQWCESVNLPAEFFDEISSTNTYAKNQKLSPTEKMKVYIARSQSDGRGRGENQWLDPQNNSALFISWLLKLEESPKTVTGPLLGLAVYKALIQAWPKTPFYIKAPNDIFVNEKKLGGILAEASSTGQEYQLIVGLGLNIWSSPESVQNAGSLNQFAKIDTDTWFEFLSFLYSEMINFRMTSQGAHLTQTEQTQLLSALNKNPKLKYPYVSISPYGDLSTEIETISWRHL